MKVSTLKRVYSSDPYVLRIGRLSFLLRSKRIRNLFPAEWKYGRNQYGYFLILGHLSIGWLS